MVSNFLKFSAAYSLTICSLFIPVDDDDVSMNQHVWKITKDAQGKVTKQRLFGVRYVPLTDAPKY